MQDEGADIDTDEYLYEEEEDHSDTIVPNFLNPTNLEEDEIEIRYYAKKLGIDPEVEEWDEQMIQAGYSKILEGITAGSLKQTKKKDVKMIKATRSETEEEARKSFTALLNRIVPSNFNLICSKLRNEFTLFPKKVAIPIFTRCITQRLFSDAVLPDMFIQVYSGALKQVPDCIQSVIETLNKSEKSKYKNIQNFFAALGDKVIDFYSSGGNEDVARNEEISKIHEAARKVHMNTDVRSGIFYAIVGATDYIEASSKLDKLQLSKAQRKEIPNVIVECCRSEDKYNPYYAVLTSHLAKNDPSFRFAMSSTIRNFFKIADQLKPGQVRNTAKFTSEILRNEVIDLTILGSVKLRKSTGNVKIFLVYMFYDLFMNGERQFLVDEFEKISQYENLKKDVTVFLRKSVLEYCKRNQNFGKERESIFNVVLNRLCQNNV